MDHSSKLDPDLDKLDSSDSHINANYYKFLITINYIATLVSGKQASLGTQAGFAFQKKNAELYKLCSKSREICCKLKCYNSFVNKASDWSQDRKQPIKVCLPF
jgi:hypothetical protein